MLLKEKKDMMSTRLGRDLLLLIRELCVEEKLPKTARMLEQETGLYFDMSYFEGLVVDGHWNRAEEYLSGFIGLQDNQHSFKIYFELRKQKYLEALDKRDFESAVDILMNDLKVFASVNLELYKDLTVLITMDNFRNHPSLSSYGDMISTRKMLINQIKPVIEANPKLNEKLEFPQFEKSRLRRLINQSLNWQHVRCVNPQPEPSVSTLFTDHSCPSASSPLESMPASGSPPPRDIVLGDSSVPESGVSPTTSDRGNSPNNESNASPPAANLINCCEQAVIVEGIKDPGIASKMNSSLPMHQMVQTDPSAIVPAQKQPLNTNVPDEFPKTVERVMEMYSPPTSMEFHPSKDTVLLVGNRTGVIELWNVSSEIKLFQNGFMLWKQEDASALLLKDLEKDPCISVNRVSWSPDGSILGVAFSKHIVQLYSYHSITNYIKKKLELDAHVGSVNDLAFSSPDNQFLVITCGDDKFIQVWDATTGSKQFTFVGHGASVYSLSPHIKQDIHFVFSTSINGEIKAWLFDNTGPRIEYDAPGRCCMRMAYSSDGKRLFSCGTNKEGESSIVEWEDSEGHIIRTYVGLSKSSRGLVQFCTTRNRFLAAGDEHVIKIWDMDNAELLSVMDADGGLPASPHLCFNKNGTILAVFADHNTIKILANDVGRRLLQVSKSRFIDSHGYLTEHLEKLGFNSTPTVTPRVQNENVVLESSMKSLAPFIPNKVLDAQKCSRIVEVSRCRSLMLLSKVKTNKISRLTYTHSGNGMLALAEDGIHLLWRLSGNTPVMHDKGITQFAPQLWLPKSGVLMINEVNPFNVNSPCLALSNNDSYIVSSSGKTVTLFNTITSQKMRTCLVPPPAATCIAFYPLDNNVIAIGLDDATIIIYNARLAEVTNRLRGHVRKISGLAFSNAFKVLVSAGVDNQIIVWNCNGWGTRNSTLLQIAYGWLPTETSETTVQFLRDERHFLVVHETQLAIYEVIKLERVKQWIIGDFCARISNATLSATNQHVYAVMRNGIILILSTHDLCPRFEIDPSVYLPANLSCQIRPVVVSAHPQKPNQIALGLSNGGVIIIEPLEPQGKWAEQPPDTNGTSADRPINV